MKKTDLDTIYLRELRLRMLIGINPDELIHRQDVYVDLALYTDTSTAALSDSIEHTTDYSKLEAKIVEEMEKSQFGLIEKMLRRIVEITFDFPLVEGVKVCVDKPDALRYGKSVAIEITRWR